MPRSDNVTKISAAAGASRLVLMKEFIETFLADCQHRWKPITFQGHSSVCRGRIRSYFGSAYVSDITAADVRTWRDEYVGSYVVPLSILSSIFEHAESVGLRKVGSNPCTGLRRKKSGFVAKYPDENDYREIWSALDELYSEEPVVVDLLIFLILTGCRRREALNLKWNQIESNKAVLPDSKSGPGTIWLAKAVTTLIESRKSRRPNGYIFSGESRKYIDKKLSWIWRRIKKDRGLDGMRIHDMRHGFASVGVSNGEDLRTIGRALGHRDPNTTLAYAHLSKQPVIDATQRVSTHIGRLLNRPGYPKNEGVRTSMRTEHEGEAYSYLERFICQKLPNRTA